MFGRIFGGGSSKKSNDNDEDDKKQLAAMGVDTSMFDSAEPTEEVDLDYVQSLASGNGDDLHVDFTDDDMNDPALLAEMKALGGDVSDDPGSPTAEELKIKIAEAKRQAVEHKRKGDLEAAKQALISSKTLQTQLDQLLANAPPSDTQPSPMLSPTPQPKQAQVPTQPAQARATAQPQVLPKQQHVSLDTSDAAMEDAIEGPDNTAEIEQRIIKYKKAALAAKKSGDQQQALAFMKDVKILQDALEKEQMGMKVALTRLPPAEPTANPSSSTASIPAVPTISSPSASTAQHQRIQTLHVLQDELNRAIEGHKKAALTAKHDGDLPAAKTALHLKKDATAHLEYVQAALDDSTMPAPNYHYETFTRTHEVMFSDIAEHEMEVTVVSVISVRPPAGYTTLSTYVACEVPYPNSDTAQKFQTSVVANTLSPQFNHAAKVFIDRKKPSFQRFLEKKQIVFTLYHSRFLVSDLVVARAELAIPELTEKAEVIKKVPLMKDGARRQPHGGELEIRVRIKTPLLKKDIRTVTEKALVIDSPLPTTPLKPAAHPQTDASDSTKLLPQQSETPQKQPVVAPVAKPQPITTASPKPPTPSPVSPQGSISPSPQTASPQTQSTPKQATVQPQPTSQAQEDLELEDVISVDNIVSNDVLEYEIDAVNTQLAAQKAAPPESLIDRKQALELKMNLLVIRVQTGQLSPEDYVEQLKKKIEEDTNLARKLVSMGKKDWARYPLTRVKIMKKEVESASESDE